MNSVGFQFHFDLTRQVFLTNIQKQIRFSDVEGSPARDDSHSRFHSDPISFASSNFFPGETLQFWSVLEYGQGINQNSPGGVKYYLSSELKHGSAHNSFGIFRERAIGIHKNLMLAAQYYQLAAQSSLKHPDSANNFGFCLKQKSDAAKNIELATEYYKLAVNCGHFEAKLNHTRCIAVFAIFVNS
jgi:hypothetical protein